MYLQKVEDHQQGDFRRTSSVRLPSTTTEPQRPHVMVQRSLSDRGKAKVIHPKYYKHLKKLLSTAIWADKNGLVSARIACISNKNLRSETI